MKWNLILVPGTWWRRTAKKRKRQSTLFEKYIEPEWYESNSQFIRSLKSELGEQFEINDPVLLDWSGDNSLISRSNASKELAAVISEIQNRENEENILVIAHSHGGNIAVDAMYEIEGAANVKIVCMGSPFMKIFYNPNNIYNKFWPAILFPICISAPIFINENYALFFMGESFIAPVKSIYEAYWLFIMLLCSIFILFCLFLFFLFFGYAFGERGRPNLSLKAALTDQISKKAQSGSEFSIAWGKSCNHGSNEISKTTNSLRDSQLLSFRQPYDEASLAIAVGTAATVFSEQLGVGLVILTLLLGLVLGAIEFFFSEAFHLWFWSTTLFLVSAIMGTMVLALVLLSRRVFGLPLLYPELNYEIDMSSHPDIPCEKCYVTLDPNDSNAPFELESMKKWGSVFGNEGTWDDVSARELKIYRKRFHQNQDFRNSILKNIPKAEDPFEAHNLKIKLQGREVKLRVRRRLSHQRHSIYRHSEVPVVIAKWLTRVH